MPFLPANAEKSPASSPQSAALQSHVHNPSPSSNGQACQTDPRPMREFQAPPDRSLSSRPRVIQDHPVAIRSEPPFQSSLSLLPLRALRQELLRLLPSP